MNKRKIVKMLGKVLFEFLMGAASSSGEELGRRVAARVLPGESSDSKAAETQDEEASQCPAQ